MDQDQGMERIFSCSILMNPPTPVDLSLELTVATRAPALYVTLIEALKVGALGREEDTGPEGVSRN